MCLAEVVCILQKLCVSCRSCVYLAEVVCILQKLCVSCRSCVYLVEVACTISTKSSQINTRIHKIIACKYFTPTYFLPSIICCKAAQKSFLKCCSSIFKMLILYNVCSRSLLKYHLTMKHNISHYVNRPQFNELKIKE